MAAAMNYIRPDSLAAALEKLSDDPGARAIAGGQSLLPAMRLGLAAPSVLIDLQAITSLRGISIENGRLRIGAMSSHAQIASSPLISQHGRLIASVAAGIADAQVRAVGTIGGSLANNDPAACWPAAVLACDARIHTSFRIVAADDFFKGLFVTALQPGELITAISFPKLRAGHYLKFEQQASRFALVGVAVAALAQGAVRVAITGLGHGVMRWHEAETRLAGGLEASRLEGLQLDADCASGDIHADARYRAHLAGVLLKRVILAMKGGAG